MKPLWISAFTLAVVALAAPSWGQNGAMWTDYRGGLVSIQFAGGGSPAPAPMDRPAAEMADLFKRLCLDSGGDEAGVALAATAAELTPTPHVVPGTKKAGPLTLNIWTANGLTLSRTDGFFAAPAPQCNTTFYVSTLPTRPDLTAAMNAAVGAQPSNLAAATDKKGQPKKNFSPEWTIDGPGGPRIVFASIGKSSQYMPGNRVQISVRAAKKAAQ
ncbi:MAG TPA: hypothetical protein VF574_04020 [Allosphingosinicella sp.]|jgi:hypothetical protein